MLFALIALIGLLMEGRILAELRWSHIGLCLLIAVVGWIATVTVHWQLGIYTAVLSAMDVVLIIIIFKGDIQIR